MVSVGQRDEGRCGGDESTLQHVVRLSRWPNGASRGVREGQKMGQSNKQQKQQLGALVIVSGRESVCLCV